LLNVMDNNCKLLNRHAIIPRKEKYELKDREGRW